MSVMFLKEQYKQFINNHKTSYEDLNDEARRIDNILSMFNSTENNHILDELETELGDILDMLEEAALECSRDMIQAKENNEYELKFKPNR